MSNLQAFILVTLLLLVESVFLIVVGFKYGVKIVAPSTILFITVDVCLIAAADVLKVVKKGDWQWTLKVLTF